MRGVKVAWLKPIGFGNPVVPLVKIFTQSVSKFWQTSGGAASGLGPTSNPATSSALPGGEGTVGDLKNRPSLADRWGDMRDSDREKIMADVQNSMPPQYQKMLEAYYKKLGKADRR